MERYRVVHLPAAERLRWGVMDTRLAYVRVRYKAEHHARHTAHGTRHTAELLNREEAARGVPGDGPAAPEGMTRPDHGGTYSVTVAR